MPLDQQGHQYPTMPFSRHKIKWKMNSWESDGDCPQNRSLQLYEEKFQALRDVLATFDPIIR